MKRGSFLLFGWPGDSEAWGEMTMTSRRSLKNLQNLLQECSAVNFVWVDARLDSAKFWPVSLEWNKTIQQVNRWLVLVSYSAVIIWASVSRLLPPTDMNMNVMKRRKMITVRTLKVPNEGQLFCFGVLHMLAESEKVRSMRHIAIKVLKRLCWAVPNIFNKIAIDSLINDFFNHVAIVTLSYQNPRTLMMKKPRGWGHQSLKR